MLNITSNTLDQLLSKAQQMQAAGRLEEAEAAFRQALGQYPNQVDTLASLAGVLIERDRMDEAMPLLERAVALQPEHPATLRAQCVLALKQGRITDALITGRNAVTLQGSPVNYAVLAAAQCAAGKIPGALESYRAAIADNSPATLSAALLALHYMPAIDPKGILAEHRAWNARHAPPATKIPRSFSNAREPDRRLRIGYLTRGFSPHDPIARFLAPLLAHHDSTGFEVFCYATGSDSSTGSVHSLAGLNDEQAEALIRHHQIDILIDLLGHLSGNRLPLLARKPAPIQIHYLGYPDTTGVDAIDYRLTDAIADPPGRTDHLHSEKLLRLTDCLVCYVPPEDAPLVGPPPVKANGHITFGNFEPYAKINAGVVGLWSAVLEAVPAAHLRLQNAALSDAGMRQNLIDQFHDRGIAAQRLELRPGVPGTAQGTGSDLTEFAPAQGVYNEIDILLDTFPWHGGPAHTCDGLYMGVPVIALTGQTAISRLTTGILAALNLSGLALPDLAATNNEQYVEFAVRMANDTFRRNKFRNMLRSRLLSSPLCDPAAFTQEVEALYRQVWREWCQAE